MGKDSDKRILEILKQPVDRCLEVEDTGVFSKTEVMRRFRDAVHRSTEKNDALELYENKDISRRQFLGLLGFGLGGAFVASSGVGWFMGKKVFDERKRLPTGYVTLDISEGDVIDEVLDANLKDGAEVHIPEGEYQWNGRGLGGSYKDMQLIGEGDVVWNVSDHIYENKVRATGDTVLLKNFTMRGQRGQTEHPSKDGHSLAGISIRAVSSNAKIVVDNVNQPDGGADESAEIGHYLGPKHKGEAVVRNCHFEHFPNNGVYGGYYQGNSGARLTVENCFFKNINIDAVRIAGSDTVRNCVMVNDDDLPAAWNGGVSGNAVRARYNGNNMTIENVDIMQKTGWHGIMIYTGTKGTIKDVRIHTDVGHRAAIKQQDGGDPWETENICIKGSGNTGHPSYMDVTDSCTVKTTGPAAIEGESVDSTSNSLDRAGGSSGTNPC